MLLRVFQHVPFEGLGAIADWAADRGAEVETVRWFAGETLPARNRGPDLLVVLGGPMSANDGSTLPWLRLEKRAIQTAIESETPTLGICLGAQLMASALGAKVVPNAHREIGWFPIHAAEPPTDAPLFSFSSPLTVFHWHGETFDLPGGAVCLASSEACRNQAVQFAPRAIGLQFHLETTAESAALLVAHCSDEMVPGPFVQSPRELVGVSPSIYAKIHAELFRLLNHLAGEAP
jgi:GMP synthase-like glutamine amidotransferase